MRRLRRARTRYVWFTLFNWLVFLTFTILAERLALNVLRRGSASETAEDLIEIALITSVVVLFANGTATIATELDERTPFPILPVLSVGLGVAYIAGLVAVIAT